MTDLNVCALVGRLTRDAETKTIGNGFVTNFTLAVGNRRKINNEWADESFFFNCALFGKLGEALSKNMTKGRQVAVTGSLRQNKWEKDGIKHTDTTILVDNIELFGEAKSKEYTYKDAKNDAVPSDDEIQF